MKGVRILGDSMPKYSKGEEIFNYVSHIVGGAFGIFSMIFCFFLCVNELNGRNIASIVVYSLSVVLLYTMSALYHSLAGRAKSIFRILDHLTIYILIAGSYTPFCLIALKDSIWGWIIFGIVWGIAIIGIILNATMMSKKSVKVISYISYVIVGWIIVIAIPDLLKSIELGGFLLLLFGGIAYTIGILFFALGKRKKWFHSIWHIWCLVGTILQFLSIVIYVF